MGDFRTPPDFIERFRRLEERVGALANVQGTPHYTTANRPAATDVPGLIIFNATTAKHQGSDGSTWSDLY